MGMLQRCLTHLKWPITLFPAILPLPPFSHLNAITRILSSARTKLLPFHCVQCSQSFFLFSLRALFGEPNEGGHTAQQKLNCILQLHIEKLNVENCCRFRRHSNTRNPLARLFFCCSFLALFPTFWHTLNSNFSNGGGEEIGTNAW